MNEMDKKKTSTQLIQAKCSKDKWTFPKEETKWQPQPCSLGEKETKLPQGAISLGKKGTKFPQGATSLGTNGLSSPKEQLGTTSPREQLPEHLIRKFKGKTLSK